MFLLGNWAFIFLHLEGFLETLPKSKQIIFHYLTYPQPDPISPKKTRKGLGRTPGHGAARTRGLNPLDVARRMAIFGWNDSPKKISMLEEERHFSSTCMFQCSWFLVVLSWWLTSWCSLFRGILNLRRFARLGNNALLVYDWFSGEDLLVMFERWVISLWTWYLCHDVIKGEVFHKRHHFSGWRTMKVKKVTVGFYVSCCFDVGIGWYFYVGMEQLLRKETHGGGDHPKRHGNTTKMAGNLLTAWKSSHHKKSRVKQFLVELLIKHYFTVLSAKQSHSSI